MMSTTRLRTFCLLSLFLFGLALPTAVWGATAQTPPSAKGPGQTTSAPSAPTTPAPAEAATPTSIDLAGTWKFAIDRTDNGEQLGWAKPDFDSSSWQQINVPGLWEEQGYRFSNSKWPSTVADDGYNGYAWYRRSIVVPATWTQQPVTLHIGAIDDSDWTFVNGTLVGSTPGENAFEAPCTYTIPANVLRPGKPNVIAIRVLDRGGEGGITDGPVALVYGTATLPSASVPGTRQPYARIIDSVLKNGSDAYIPSDTQVNGDVIVNGGSATIEGFVTGNVKVNGGSVTLTQTAHISGDVTVSGGTVKKADGAEVMGTIEDDSTRVQIQEQEPVGMPGAQYASESPLVPLLPILLFIAILAALLFPRRLEVMARALPADPTRAALVGLIGIFMYPAVIIAFLIVIAFATILLAILAIVIVGLLALPAIPLVIAAFFLLLGVIPLLGTVGVWMSLGQAILDRVTPGRRFTPIWSTLLGMLVLWLLGFIPIIGALIWVTVILFGLGVALMTGLGIRERWSISDIGRPLHRRREPAPEIPTTPMTETGETTPPTAPVSEPTPETGEAEGISPPE